MSDDFWGGFALAAVIVGGIAWYEYPKAPPQIGRYQIQSDKDGLNFLLDSATGETWRWVYTDKDKNGMPINWTWTKAPNFQIEMKDKQ